jgi:predicted dehydrogenase
MIKNICRWGILSTAGIAHKNWKAIWYAPNARVTRVASRTLERAQAFIDSCQSEAPFKTQPQPLAHYDDLLSCDDVDAVYIPLPTGIRKEWVLKAAAAGKHVLAEKPSAVCVSDLEEMLWACEQNNVQYMDGVMYMHSERLSLLRQLLEDGSSIGRIKRIHCHHAFKAPESFMKNNIRVNSSLEPHGCLGDLGYYCLRFILWAMNWELPKQITARILTEVCGQNSEKTVPGELSAELFFANNISSSIYCSFFTEHQQWVNIGGEKGFLFVPDFVLPFVGNELEVFVFNSAFHISGCTFNMEKHIRRLGVSEYGSGHSNAQETKMITNFSELALSGKTDTRWGKYSLATQRVLDACLSSALSNGKIINIAEISSD